jgi:hypothetical protein
MHNSGDAMMLPTDKIIEQAIEELKALGAFNEIGFHHESNDCARIAFAFLDAQKTIKSPSKGGAYKHTIEKWAGRYISTTSVIIAAYLHPTIKGEYPAFNLSAITIYPCHSRLLAVTEAYTHYYHIDNFKAHFGQTECLRY